MKRFILRRPMLAVLVVVFSELTAKSWEGWDRWVAFGAFLTGLLTLNWIFDTLELPKPKTSLPAGAVFSCPECKTVLYPQSLVRPVRGPDNSLICPNCYATVKAHT